jgi:hypothetical protein
MIHGRKTVGRISCSTAYTHEIFHSLPEIDYAVAYTESGTVLWVADGMTDEIWSMPALNETESGEQSGEILRKTEDSILTMSINMLQ